MAVLGIQNSGSCMYGMTVLVFNFFWPNQNSLSASLQLLVMFEIHGKLFPIYKDKTVDCVHTVLSDLTCKECNIF